MLDNRLCFGAMLDNMEEVDLAHHQRRSLFASFTKSTASKLYIGGVIKHSNDAVSTAQESSLKFCREIASTICEDTIMLSQHTYGDHRGEDGNCACQISL
jgi:hypothetical protein